jgi:DNA-binding GntR family transcriptional regulator
MPLPESGVKLSRTLAREEVYGRLRRWIIEGTLAPGEVLRDQAIAASMGVSRTPVREALRRLQDEGFTEAALNRWTRVAPIDLNEAAASYAVIESLEVLALERAFAELTPADLQEMTDANRAIERAADRQKPIDAVTADEAFHAVLICRAANSVLAAVLGQLKTKLRRVELAHFGAAARAHSSFREHAAILKALKGRSLPEAISSLRRNWQASLKRLTGSQQRRNDGR